MRQDEIWDVETARQYDTRGVGMWAPEVLGPSVDRLVALADDGATPPATSGPCQHADWTGAVFVESRSHVSVYRLPAA